MNFQPASGPLAASLGPGLHDQTPVRRIAAEVMLGLLLSMRHATAVAEGDMANRKIGKGGNFVSDCKELGWVCGLGRVDCGRNRNGQLLS